MGVLKDNGNAAQAGGDELRSKPWNFIGLGFWQAWWMCAMCSSALVPIGASPFPFDVRFAIQIATDLGYLGFVLAAHTGAVKQLHAVRAMRPVSAAVFCVGTFVLALVAHLNEPILQAAAFFVACVCIAFGNAALLILWAEHWSTLATGRVGRHLYLSYLFAFVLFFVVYALPAALGAVAVSAFPLVSALLLKSCASEPKRTSVREPLQMNRRPLVGFFAMILLMSVVYGVSQSSIAPTFATMGAAEQANVPAASLLVAGVFLALFVLNIIASSPESEAVSLFRAVMPTMVLGLVFTLMLPDAYVFAGNGLVILGVYLLDMLVMLLSTDVSFRTGRPVASTFGLAVLVTRIGTLVGTGVVVAGTMAGLWSAEVVRGAFLLGILCLVVAGSLCFNQADLERIYQTTPPADLPDKPAKSTLTERCDAVAAQYGLTAREREVLELLARGRTVQDVCSELVIAQGTAKHHVSNIYRKLGVYNRRALFDVVEQA